MHTLEARAPGRAVVRSVSIELAALADQLTAVERRWRALAGTMTPAQFNWRPASGRWSVGEHLAHLNLVDAGYLPYLDAMIARGHADGLVPRPGSRHPLLGRLLINGAEPPVSLRVRTADANVPPAHVDRDGALAELAAVRRALRERIAAATGLDPRRVRARYLPGIGPARWATLSLGQWLALTAAHDRRHLWLAERVVGSPGFPRADDGFREIVPEHA
jgi:hypothetical protein